MTRVPRPRDDIRAAPEAEQLHEADTIDECPGCDAELDEHDDRDLCGQCGESIPATFWERAAGRPSTGVPAGTEAAERAAKAEAVRAGTVAAQFDVTRKADAGMGADAVGRQVDDQAARMASEAEHDHDRWFAGAYGRAGTGLVAELRDLDRPEPAMRPGEPHRDRSLAGRGWETGPHGIYTRTGERQAEWKPPIYDVHPSDDRIKAAVMAARDQQAARQREQADPELEAG